MTPLSHRQSLIWIKARNPSEGFLEVTSFSGAANMKEALEVSGSLARAGELLEHRTRAKIFRICEHLRPASATIGE
jgi:hypothetical protein